MWQQSPRRCSIAVVVAARGGKAEVSWHPRDHLGLTGGCAAGVRTPWGGHMTVVACGRSAIEPSSALNQSLMPTETAPFFNLYLLI
jgi:hypothetical protein